MFLAAEIKGADTSEATCARSSTASTPPSCITSACATYKTFKRVAYSDVEKQVLRLERTPFGRLLTEQTDDDHPDDDQPDDEHKVSAAAIGRMRFNMGLLLVRCPVTFARVGLAPWPAKSAFADMGHNHQRLWTPH